MPESDVGQFFGKYFLLKKLAAGGMGEVFLAKQQGPAGFEKILVVKKVLAHLTENKEFVELFLGEARLAARMSHRNIVQVFELGEHEGNYYIAMEFVQGKALRDVIDACIKRKEKLPAELCRNVVEQICDGASYAHNLTDVTGRSLNIIHRDLNPQNVLISYTGDVKVIDFGIAKSEMSTVKTEAGMIKGKFVYMSPEQSLAKKLDKRSDIFAIGITLYEMLTGVNPFHKNNIVLTLEAIQRYDPPPPSEYDPSLAPFDPIIAKVLAKDRDRRYSDAGEMLDDLRRIVVPPSPERLGVFMSRIFRAQLEEEQKILKDTDSARVTGSASVKRTPAKPSAAPHPTSDQPDGGTLLLAPPPKGGAKGNTPAHAAPARPAPRAPAPPPAKKPVVNQGGDTLMDMEAPKIPGVNAPADDAPGATMMLKPGQAMPPPPAPKRKPAVMETIPDGGLVAPRSQAAQASDDEGGENKTAFLGTAPARAPERKKAPTADDAPRAPQRPQQSRGNSRVGPPPKKKGLGLWIGLGVGGVALLGGVIALVLVLTADDAPRVKRKARPAVETAATAPVDPTPAPEDKKTDDAKPPETAAPAAEAPKRKKAEEKPAESAPAAAPEKKKADAAPAQEKPAEKKSASITPPAAAASPKAVGTLMVNPGPNVPLSFAGSKSAGMQRLNVTADAGTLEIGDASTQFKVVLDYARTGKELVFKVRSEPWAIVSVDQVSKGKTPLADLHVEDKMSVVELKKPGQDPGMTFRLRFTPN